MLRITIELLPGGREDGKRVIATADIARVSSGALADYRVALDDAVLGQVGERATVRGYPRWADSVWDLVARCVAAALNQGREALPPRPAPPQVTVRMNAAGYRYVRLDEIPEPASTRSWPVRAFLITAALSRTTGSIFSTASADARRPEPA